MEPTPTIPQQILQIEVLEISAKIKEELIEFDITSMSFPK